MPGGHHPIPCGHHWPLRQSRLGPWAAQPLLQSGAPVGCRSLPWSCVPTTQGGEPPFTTKEPQWRTASLPKLWDHQDVSISGPAAEWGQGSCLPHSPNPKGLSRPESHQTHLGPQLRFPHSTRVLLKPRVAVASSLAGPQSTAGPSQGQSRALARCGGPGGVRMNQSPFPLWGEFIEPFPSPMYHFIFVLNVSSVPQGGCDQPPFQRRGPRLRGRQRWSKLAGSGHP